jgi:hypothetical protein
MATYEVILIDARTGSQFDRAGSDALLYPGAAFTLRDNVWVVSEVEFALWPISPPLPEGDEPKPQIIKATVYPADPPPKPWEPDDAPAR